MKVSKILSAFLALIMIIGCFGAISVSADGGSESTPYTVYVSESGNDSAAGTQDAPVATITKATALIAEKENITEAIVKIVGTVATSSSSNTSEASHTNITITYEGNNEEATLKLGRHLALGGPVIFKNLKINCNNVDRYIYYNDYKLIMGEGLKMTDTSNKLQLVAGYGGISTINSVNLTINSGKYKLVATGDLNTCTVNGAVNLEINGTDTVVGALYIGGNGVADNQTHTVNGKTTVIVNDGTINNFFVGEGKTGSTCTFKKDVYLKINGGCLASTAAFGVHGDCNGNTVFENSSCIVDFSGYKDVGTDTGINFHLASKWKSKLNAKAASEDYKKTYKVTDCAVIGMQAKTESADNKTDIRFLVGLRDYNNTAATIRIVAKWGENNERTFTQPITTVYDSISEVTDKGLKEVKATDKGVRYIMALTLTGVPTNEGEITFEVTPIIKVNGGTEEVGPTSILEYPTDVE